MDWKVSRLPGKFPENVNGSMAMVEETLKLSCFCLSESSLARIIQVVLMERESDEIWAKSYAGMFTYYREQVSSSSLALQFTICQAEFDTTATSV